MIVRAHPCVYARACVYVCALARACVMRACVRAFMLLFGGFGSVLSCIVQLRLTCVCSPLMHVHLPCFPRVCVHSTHVRVCLCSGSMGVCVWCVPPPLRGVPVFGVRVFVRLVCLQALGVRACFLVYVFAFVCVYVRFVCVVCNSVGGVRVCLLGLCESVSCVGSSCVRMSKPWGP